MRNRIKVISILIVVIGLGLSSRKFSGLFPAILDKYPGDAFWTMAVYLGWAVIFPSTEPIKLMWFALITSFLVEVSQIYHIIWLDELRNNAIGHLFLGSTFNAMDFVAYSVGILSVFIIDLLIHKRGLINVRNA
jgi:hypothetical protein